MIVNLVGVKHDSLTTEFLGLVTDLAQLDIYFGGETFEFLGVRESEPFSRVYDLYKIDNMVFWYN